MCILGPSLNGEIRNNIQPGAPEAVLDWGGGGGGQRPKGAQDIFSVGAHQWRSQLFGMGEQEYQM